MSTNVYDPEREAELKAEAEKYIPPGYDPDLYKIRHSAAHIMAQAVMERFPGARIAIGPPVKDGFYYDFELPRSPTEEDLAWIEQRMKEIIKGKHRFHVREVSVEEARELFKDQPYKLELIEGLARGQYDEYGNKLPEDQRPKITVYQHDTFIDLCRGPHVEHTGQIKANAVKVMRVAGAYWRGDEKNPMLTRIYGTAWRNRVELEQYLKRLEEAKKRDHRRLGKDLAIFAIEPQMVGPGLVLWQPNGAVIRDQLERFLKEEQIRRGYQPVYTPHIAKVELFKTSGHYPYYKDSMFPPMVVDENEEYLLKPMNCPFHIMIYKQHLRSYRDLPIRFAEFGTVYRFEQSGEVSGMTRVRGFTQDDAHLFCRPDQLEDEFKSVVELTLKVFRSLGLTDFRARVGVRDPESDKYVGSDEVWEQATQAILNALNDYDFDYTVEEGEAAFYGPKLDFVVNDVLGREWQLGTVQVDYNLPQRFDLTYIGEDNQPHRPVMIHRAPFGSMERFVGILIEHLNGAFPPWLAPVQVVVIPIADRHIEYARSVAARLFQQDLRVKVDDSANRMNAKIRAAQMQKIPYMLIVGDKEVEEETVAVRLRSGEDLGAMPVGEFEAKVRQLVAQRTMDLW
ncbi:threonyl-tRNA synthetase [Ardenticatena maritima]|uniref:Threonine--tRNA ligase n=1 Tax=Ardenticatena maritima TaxID=872965 RepID=A0A0M8K542_9CHLR|nr:threonine--tRNA ligase [Ardenticatena maritima]GAP61805.1 threonyl-tRNA synthetase [Ardenticatena maritima]